MDTYWTVHDKTFEKFIPAEEIKKKVAEVARKINEDLKGQKRPIFLVVLNGAFVFASDLLQNVTLDCEIEFIKLSSYQGTTSAGTVKEVMGLNTSVAGHTVVIIEDIIDTGLTVDMLIGILKSMGAAEIKVAACLFKKEAFKKEYPIDYCCFEIPDKFVVGYGLDYDGLGRNSSGIYKLVE